jgi:hypothetical protein
MHLDQLTELRVLLRPPFQGIRRDSVVIGQGIGRITVPPDPALVPGS